MSKIAAKLVLAMDEIDAVTKRGKNEKQQYNYVKAADVANEVRPVLTKHGIAFTFSVLSEDRWEKPTQSGGIMNFCSLQIAVTFTDSESGESITANTIGWGADSLEKAPYKAMTGALKYALRMNFIIPDESDPENDKGEPRTELSSAPQPSAILHSDSEPQIRPRSQKGTPQPQQTQPAASQPQQQPLQGEVSPEPSISKPQANRFFAIMRSTGLSDDEVKARLGKLGYHGHRDNMPRRIYEAAIDAIDDGFKFHERKG